MNANGTPDVDFLRKIAKIIKESRNKFGIVTGGGKVARDYANAARKLGANEFEADAVAILATKKNAHLMVHALRGMSYGSVLDDFELARAEAKGHKVVVMGGTIPGITTDTDSVLLAEAVEAKRLVNISNVEAIYDKDPKTNPNAKRYSRMTYEQLSDLAARSDKRKAGTHFIFDMLACKLIARSGIETHFVSGKRLSDVRNAIEGKKHGGTVVKA